MANQDYISRSPVKKKKSTRRNKKTAKKSNGLPLKSKVISVILLILIGAFVYGLWTLKTDPSTKDPIASPTKKEVVKENNADTTPLPKKPEEKWTYKTKLIEQEIEVGEYKVEEKGPYRMQCGSFKTLERADALKAKIAFTGLEANIKKTSGKNGIWYKVILGQYPRKRLAEKDKHMLKKNGVNGCQIRLLN